MDNLWILAQTEGQQVPTSIPGEPVSDQGEAKTLIPSDANAPPTGTEGRRTTGGYTHLIFIGLMFIILYFVLFRGPQKQKQQHKKMVPNAAEKRPSSNNRRNYRNHRRC
jgi:hypothetical protein